MRPKVGYCLNFKKLNFGSRTRAKLLYWTKVNFFNSIKFSKIVQYEIFKENEFWNTDICPLFRILEI